MSGGRYAEQTGVSAERSVGEIVALLVKASLEAVEAGIVTFERAFLPYLVLPDNRTTARPFPLDP